MAMPLLNKRTKTALDMLRKKDEEDYIEFDSGFDFYFDDSTHCCGIVEGSGDPTVNKKEVLYAINLVGKHTLMLYNAPNIPAYRGMLRLLKSLGFKQMIPEWKNGVHARRKQGVITLMCYKDV